MLRRPKRSKNEVVAPKEEEADTVERKYRTPFYEIIENILYHLPACFSKTENMDFFFFFCLLNCEKFAACKLKCNFPDQFVRKLGTIYEGELAKASVKFKL